MIPTLDPKDFVFTFESKGTSFIFEDLVIAHGYMKGESVTIGMDGGTRVFVALPSVMRMNAEGARRTASETEQSADTLYASIEQIRVKTAALRERGGVTKEEYDAALATIQKIMDEYAHFDVHFTDGAYAAAKTDSEAEANLVAIEKHKNAIRSGLNTVFFDDDSYLSALIRTIASQGGVPVDELSWYTAAELGALLDGTVADASVLSDRKEAFFYYVDPSLSWTLVAGKEARKLAEPFAVSNEQLTEFKGVTAYGTGKTKGVVKIIRRDYSHPEYANAAMAAMQDGDILVTETTDPDLMEGFRKAGAVVTDVGGMLSHAAITARELRKPCIIGTGTASKILKDGDMVEVDADTGKVRIIDRV